MILVGHKLDHVLDHMLDHMIIGFMTNVLQKKIFYYWKALLRIKLLYLCIGLFKKQFID